MPKSIIKNCKLDIKSSSLDRLVDAYLSQSVATRVNVAQKHCVSTSTSGKVASALVECGFAEQRLYADKGQRPSLHLFIKEGLNALVIDLSRGVYTMSIISPYGKCLFMRDHIYDTSLSYEDNLNVFLSRQGYQAKMAQKSFYTISVIFSDSKHLNAAALSDLDAYVPTMHDKDKTDRVIRSVFKRQAITYTNLSDALFAAINFGVVPSTDVSCGASYLFIGAQINAFNVSSRGCVHCDIGSLIIDGDTCTALTRNRVSSDALELILTRIVNMMQCAFTSSSIIIDSDIYSLNEQMIRNICRNCAKAGVLTPTVIASTNASSITHTGAMKLALSNFIRTMIHASDENANK